MREIRQSGSEGGGAGKSTGPPYPYYACAPSGRSIPKRPPDYYRPAKYTRSFCLGLPGS